MLRTKRFKYFLRHTNALHYQKRQSNILACKEALLLTARASLLAAPFIWHFKLHKKYKKTTGWLIKTPIVLACLAIAIGLDQCPITGRWRLLWMSEQDELEWSNQRLKTLLNKDENLTILDKNDHRTKLILAITRRLVNTLPSSNKHSILPTWPDPITHGISSLIDRRDLKKPSTTTSNIDIVNFPDGLTLYHPNLQVGWNIYVINDDNQFNAYAMPSKELVIYTGLMELLDYREDFLSTVLAHEIAHVTQRHAIENVSTDHDYICLTDSIFS